MTNILDQVARTSARAQYGHFRPATTQEFFALRLAARMGDGAAAQHYVELADHHSQGQLLEAYRRALASHVDTARRFHVELEPLKGRNSDTGMGGRLVAIRVERRAVAVAIFSGDHLKHADARQLSSAPEKALASASSFVSRVMEKFRFDSVALEIIPNGHEVQRSLLHQAVVRVLRTQAVSIATIAKSELMAAFGHPPLRFRGELREIVSEIYPVLDQQPGAPWTHDAAALGLYVQTERLFQNIN